MGETSSGFGKFIPGFEFLQNIGKGGAASNAALPPFAHWVAPTMRVEEIEKRIEELKAVQFWLEQNSKALAATVQALEVQKMTLSTLQSMNVNLSDMAQGFPFAAPRDAAAAQGDLSDWPLSAAGKAKEAASAAPAAAPSQSTQPEPEVAPPQAGQGHKSEGDAAQAASMATAMQWWGALTQQFQQIAQQALQDPAQQQAVVQATQMTSEFAKTAVQAASDMLRKAVVPAAPPATASKGTARSTAKSAAASSTQRSAAKKTASTDKQPVSATATSARKVAKKSSAKKPSQR